MVYDENDPMDHYPYRRRVDQEDSSWCIITIAATLIMLIAAIYITLNP